MIDARAAIAEFLSTQMFCVVSSLGGDGSPQSAMVAFSEAPDFSIAFGTFVDSRKYRNIVHDPRVAITISGDDRTVQIEGTARLAEGEEEEHCRRQHLAKNPKAKKYAYEQRERFVVVTPSWMRFTDFTTDPDTVEEIRFS